jgi:hypothetical protein
MAQKKPLVKLAYLTLFKWGSDPEPVDILKYLYMAELMG